MWTSRPSFSVADQRDEVVRAQPADAAHHSPPPYKHSSSELVRTRRDPFDAAPMVHLPRVCLLSAVPSMLGPLAEDAEGWSCLTPASPIVVPLRPPSSRAAHRVGKVHAVVDVSAAGSPGSRRRASRLDRGMIGPRRRRADRGDVAPQLRSSPCGEIAGKLPPCPDFPLELVGGQARASSPRSRRRASRLDRGMIGPRRRPPRAPRPSRAEDAAPRQRSSRSRAARAASNPLMQQL